MALEILTRVFGYGEMGWLRPYIAYLKQKSKPPPQKRVKEEQ